MFVVLLSWLLKLPNTKILVAWFGLSVCEKVSEEKKSKIGLGEREKKENM